MIAQNLFKLSVYGDGPEKCVMTQAKEKISFIDISTKHQMDSLSIVPGKPGYPALDVECAVFCYPGTGGHVWVNFKHLVECLGLQAVVGNPCDWFRKRADRWDSLAQDHGLSTLAVRPSQPYKKADLEKFPERCLLFPSVSVHFLLFLSERSAWAWSSRHGKLSEEKARKAFDRVFQGLMAHLPPDFILHVRLDRGATQATLGHRGALPAHALSSPSLP